MTPSAGWPHRERVKVRYAEVDAQQVVFNAHYLTWCDVASSGWAEAAAGWTGVGDPVDWMVVRAVIEWASSAAYGDLVDIDCGVSRWGNRSFDAVYRGTVDGRPVFEATITYVTIDPGTKTSVPGARVAPLGRRPNRSGRPGCAGPRRWFRSRPGHEP